jgi:hypothetical protein
MSIEQRVRSAVKVAFLAASLDRNRPVGIFAEEAGA